jgi:hypothetical protein
VVVTLLTGVVTTAGAGGVAGLAGGWIRRSVVAGSTHSWGAAGAATAGAAGSVADNPGAGAPGRPWTMNVAQRAVTSRKAAKGSRCSDRSMSPPFPSTWAVTQSAGAPAQAQVRAREMTRND